MSKEPKSDMPSDDPISHGEPGPPTGSQERLDEPRGRTGAVLDHDSGKVAEAGTGLSVNALPDDALIILPVRNVVVFPGVALPISIGRQQSLSAARAAARMDRPIGVLLQREPGIDRPGPDDLHRIGTIGKVLKVLTGPEDSQHLICQGEQRFRVTGFIEGYPYLAARYELIEDPDTSGDTEVAARGLLLKQKALEALQLLPQAPAELSHAIQAIDNPAHLADMVTSYMDLEPQEKQRILETLDIKARLDKVMELVSYRVEVLRLTHEIGQQTKETMDERQREYLLREQLRTIQKELGDDDQEGAEIEELRQAIEAAQMPEEVHEQALKELKRLERMPEASGEYSMVRTYLDWLIELPWAKLTAGDIDIARAREILDADHYGLEKVKRRILEFLAVRKLAPEGKSPVLCFVGPPGVGKTSLGRSIARATGREFVRASLGGVHDEAEIRGHRRTYLGALPGVIVQNIRKAGARDCVFMLDEMDKLGAGFQGDPSSALLEVLDPEQNDTFRDNYLAVPFDLSRVMFIATANVLDNIPGPLRDRMEVIELPGYTASEKLEIAKRYLVDRQREANGLTQAQCVITEDALRRIIDDYTREAGCRNLEREIGAICRRVAMQIAEGELSERTITADDLAEILGPPRFESEAAQRTSSPGVATGLAWTPVGGDILFIEALLTPGKGNLILTGQLGDVMKESAQAAMSLVKARAASLDIDSELFTTRDVHVHVPAGAIPKDGPSAGVAMFVALASAFAERKVRKEVAMTGEISLRGLVLPVGGIKEKVLAAHRAGIKTVMLPKRNRKEFEEIPEEARKALRFVWLEDVDQALSHALTARRAAGAGRKRAAKG